MTNWNWLESNLIHAIHDRQLAEHGGGDGVRDAGAIESALARAQNLASYGQPDAAALAAAYCFGIAKNHGFVDGNKRTAWIAARLFLLDNGFDITYDPINAVQMVEGVAGGGVSEEAFAEWLRERMVRAD